MGRYIKILMFLMTAAFFLSCFSENAFAEEDLYVSDWTVNATLKENGDLEISEDITYKFNDKYNGIYRDIALGDYYSVADISVEEKADSNLINYELADKAKNGDKNVFTVKEEKNKVLIKVYSPSKDEEKTFRFSYVVKNIAVKYKDTGELYYKFLNEGNETPIRKFTVNIKLPYEDKDDRVKVFAHGPLNGVINKINNIKYQLKVNNVPAKTFIEGRLLFPTDFIGKSSNYRDINRYQDVINEENALQQKKEKDIIRNEKIKKLLNITTLCVSSLSIVVFIAVLYLCRRKVNPDMLSVKYKNIPEDCTPAVAARLIGAASESNIFFATILDLFRKGLLTIKGKDKNVDISKNKDFVIYKTGKDDSDLLDHERYFMRWLFDEMGNGESVSTDDIKHYSKHNQSGFYRSLKTWKNKIKKEIDIRGYLDHSKGNLGIILLFISVINLILGFITIINENLIALLSVTTGFVLLIYGIYLFYRLSDKGYIQSKKWKSFMNYMKNYNPDLSGENVLESPDESLIYALGLGVIKKELFDVCTADCTSDNWLFWYILFGDTADAALNSAINDSFAQSPSSYGSFTDGGGGGAAGGGTGGF